MGVFEHFPYVNFHELNLSWIVNKIKELEDVIGTQIVDIVARAGVAANTQAINNLTATVNANAITAHNEALAASNAAAVADGKAVTAQSTADAINTFLTKATSTPSYEPNINPEWMSVTKSGNVVCLSFSVNSSTQWVNGWNNLFTISDPAFQPSLTYEFDGVDNSSDNSLHMQISTNGIVRFYKPSGVTVGVGIRGSETFMN